MMMENEEMRMEGIKNEKKSERLRRV